MKKYLIALLFGMSLMSMQTASAATLSLTNFSGSSNTSTGGPAAEVFGDSVAGSNAGWVLTVADTASPVNVTFKIVGTPPFAGILFGGTNIFLPVTGPTFTALLGTGSYIFALSSSVAAYTFSAALDSSPAVGDVPVPAAVWLFGSALLGLIGVTGRKSQPALAA